MKRPRKPAIDGLPRVADDIAREIVEHVDPAMHRVVIAGFFYTLALRGFHDARRRLARANEEALAALELRNRTQRELENWCELVYTRGWIFDQLRAEARAAKADDERTEERMLERAKEWLVTGTHGDSLDVATSLAKLLTEVRNEGIELGRASVPDGCTGRLVHHEYTFCPVHDQTTGKVR